MQNLCATTDGPISEWLIQVGNCLNKRAKATEIKAYIYAWCNQFKKKPEYTYETIGTFPKGRMKNSRQTRSLSSLLPTYFHTKLF